MTTCPINLMRLTFFQISTTLCLKNFAAITKSSNVCVCGGGGDALVLPQLITLMGKNSCIWCLNLDDKNFRKVSWTRKIDFLVIEGPLISIELKIFSYHLASEMSGWVQSPHVWLQWIIPDSLKFGFGDENILRQRYLNSHQTFYLCIFWLEFPY